LENYILIDNDLWDYVLLSIRYGDKSKWNLILFFMTMQD
jgi:hypothetical protein